MPSEHWTPLYKLTDDTMRTYRGYQWTVGPIHAAWGTGPLCSEGWLHAYRHPLVALMMNVGDLGIQNPRLFRAEGVIGLEDNGLQVGCTALRLCEELPIPAITTEHRVTMAMFAALKVYSELEWLAWATRWLDGNPGARSREEQQAQSAKTRIHAMKDVPHAWPAWWAIESAGMTVFSAEDAAMAIRMASYAAQGGVDFGAMAERAMEHLT